MCPIRKGSRLEQIIDWLGGDPSGSLIVLDECHKAKNMQPTSKGGQFGMQATQTGLSVAKLQSSLPRAHVLYSSATGASEPANMHYMTRCVSIWR